MTDTETAAAETDSPTLPLPPPQPENFPLAVAAGLGAALVGAAIWAVVTVVTEMELGIIAVALGFMVGKAVGAVGHGRSQKFGILGAVCGLIGCVLGSLLSYLAFYASAMHLSYTDVLGVWDFALIRKLMAASFSPMDLIFYAIAVYEGYRFSFHR